MTANRELLEQMSYERRRDRMAERIFPFLRDMVKKGRAEPATYNRETVMLVLDAFRSKRFMDLVEHDELLSYEMKVQISQMVTGANKSWSAVQRLIFSDKSDELASVALAIVDSIVTVLQFCGIQYIEVVPESGADVR